MSYKNATSNNKFHFIKQDQYIAVLDLKWLIFCTIFLGSHVFYDVLFL